MSLTESKNQSQKVGLLSLPNELLFYIIADEKMSWRDHFNIHHVSSRLFRLIFKHVYHGKRDIFHHACSSANIDLMIECVKHGDIPTGRLWHLPGDLFYDTPLDLLSSTFQDGDCSADQYIKAAEWLFDNGYQTQRFQRCGRKKRVSRIVSPFLLTMFATATDADNHRGICQVIEFLTNKGLGIPPPSIFLRRVSYKKHIDDHPGYQKLARDSGSDMDMMLQSASPPALFEVFLKNLLSDFGLTLKSRLAPGYRRGLYTCEWTKINELVRILFDDLFAPWIYKGDSPSYFSDTFEAKIKLLIKYEGIDGNEQSALENILEALRSIEARQRDNGGLNFERDGAWCWRELCVSICHITSMQNYEWYPPKALIIARSILYEDVRDKLDPSWLEDSTERDWVNMPLDAWNYVHPNWRMAGREIFEDQGYRSFGQIFDEDGNEREAGE
ncbi:hypothetical protein FMUND_11793 [Fusarium mundagurra]|uniref:Uncharacterized protein n=1 Tax=Fusarium mundagurra TaxID=1567541 RepID=A0A8H6D6F6_9HYPO|nr:hypothetical protein FMUND_11793 [Fusarium mundagurra]